MTILRASVRLPELTSEAKRFAGPDISLNRSASRDGESAEVIEFLPEQKPNQEIFFH